MQSPVTEEKFIPDFNDSINNEIPGLENRKEGEAVERYKSQSETEEQTYEQTAVEQISSSALITELPSEVIVPAIPTSPPIEESVLL